jgi:hypothetical protein
METIFQAPFIWIKAWNKNCERHKPCIVACAVIPQMGVWTLRNGQFIKSIYIANYMAQNDLKACQPTETKVQPKKQQKKTL